MCLMCQSLMPEAGPRRRFCSDRCRKNHHAKRRREGQVVPDHARRQIRELTVEVKEARTMVQDLEKKLVKAEKKVGDRDRKVARLKYRLTRVEKSAGVRVSEAAQREADAKTVSLELRHRAQRAEQQVGELREQLRVTQEEVDRALAIVQVQGGQLDDLSRDRDQKSGALEAALAMVQEDNDLLSIAQDIINDMWDLIGQLRQEVPNTGWWPEFLEDWTQHVQARDQQLQDALGPGIQDQVEKDWTDQDRAGEGSGQDCPGDQDSPEVQDSTGGQSFAVGPSPDGQASPGGQSISGGPSPAGQSNSGGPGPGGQSTQGGQSRTGGQDSPGDRTARVDSPVLVSRPVPVACPVVS